MADVKTRAYYAPYDNDYYIPDAEGEKRVGKNENWRDIEKGFYLVQAKNDEQDGQFANIEAKDEEQDGRLDAIDAKDAEQDSRLDAIEAVNTQQNLDIQTNRTTITGLDTRLTSAESLLDAVSQTSVENSAAIAQLQTEQAALSGRMDTTNAQVADNSTRLTRAENNITSNTQELQLHGAQISDLEDQAVIRLQATFDRQTETVTLTDPAAAYDVLSSGHNAVIDLLIDNSFASIYTKDIDNSTNNTYRFTHAETGVDAGGKGYTGLDAITITLDPLTETVSTVSWSNVYNLSEERAEIIIQNAIGSLNTTNWQNGEGQGSVKLPNNNVSGQYSVAAGAGLTVSGNVAAAFGAGCKATNDYAHAEGSGTTASGAASHTEGSGTTASGQNSHSEGLGTTASGQMSHAEGNSTQASGAVSHSEGNGSSAIGSSSHAEGFHTIANGQYQHASGSFNIADLEGANGRYVEIIGNGADEAHRSNARTLDWSGNEVIAGNLTASGGTITIGSTSITEAQLQALLALLT